MPHPRTFHTPQLVFSRRYDCTYCTKNSRVSVLQRNAHTHTPQVHCESYTSRCHETDSGHRFRFRQGLSYTSRSYAYSSIILTSLRFQVVSLGGSICTREMARSSPRRFLGTSTQSSESQRKTVPRELKTCLVPVQQRTLQLQWSASCKIGDSHARCIVSPEI